jgi:hypothetical protein
VPRTIPTMIRIRIDRRCMVRGARKLPSWRRRLMLMRWLMRWLIRWLMRWLMRWLVLHMMPDPPLLLAPAAPRAGKVLHLQCHGPIFLPCTTAPCTTTPTPTPTATLTPTATPTMTATLTPSPTVISTTTLFHALLTSLCSRGACTGGHTSANPLKHTLSQTIP